MEPLESPNRDEDAEVRRAASGDEGAMRTLIERYEESLFGFLFRRLENRADAADCTQEVFLKMIRSLPTYQPRRQFRAWLFTIARNESLNWIRKHRSRIVEFSLQDQDLPIEKEFESASGGDTSLGPAGTFRRCQRLRQQTSRSRARRPRTATR